MRAPGAWPLELACRDERELQTFLVVLTIL